MTEKKNDLRMGRRRPLTASGLAGLPPLPRRPPDLDTDYVLGTEAPTPVTTELPHPEDVVRSANRSAGKPYPKRVALDLTDGQLRALREAHVDDGIPITTRVRALVRLWMERPELAKEAAELAQRDVEAARQARTNSRLNG